MRVKHISDNHSLLPTLIGDFDVVLLTGDFFPNSDFLFAKNRIKEAEFQLNWLKQNLTSIYWWLGNKPLLFTVGNHDFLSPDLMEQILRAEGIEAYNLTNKIVSFQGVNFFGFPYVSPINGFYMYETPPDIMRIKTGQLAEMINNGGKVDVLCCHSPPAGILDLTSKGVRIGSSHILNMLQYKIDADKKPQVIAFGHNHHQHGMTIKYDMLFVNSATTQSIIEL